jgi:ribose transport system permease protein
MSPLWKRVILSENLVLGLSGAWVLVLWPFAPEVVSPGNLANVLSSSLPLLAAVIGQTLVLIAGGIDLSAPAIISLASIGGALVLTGGGSRPAAVALEVPAGVAAMLAAGGAIGAMNGLAVAVLRLPPFIVTLTSGMIFSGLAVWMTGSRAIHPLPGSFNSLGKSVWGSLAIAGGLAALCHLVLVRSIAGRWLFAAGRNPRSARISGVPVRAVTVGAYAAAGFLAAVASVIYTGRLETGDPVLGKYLLLDIIAAAVIGGNSLRGGKGKVRWAVSGVLFITLLDNGLNLLFPSQATVFLAKGSVIVLAALLDGVRTRLETEG